MYQHVGSWSWFLGRKVHLSATAAPTRMNIALPPDILDTGTSTDMVVREGSNVSFQCAASGSPPPSITWRRESGEPITLPTGVEERPVLSKREISLNVETLRVTTLPKNAATFWSRFSASRVRPEQRDNFPATCSRCATKSNRLRINSPLLLANLCRNKVTVSVGRISRNNSPNKNTLWIDVLRTALFGEQPLTLGYERFPLLLKFLPLRLPKIAAIYSTNDRDDN
ncbi:unnamed protein product [Nesidiocoris tenuis]|uniref:Ig-like domain-containing protein n=1 Tax=Nesidiocoris tenuis TaxID=355587 RepID=A0A6H5HC83_9HEMI|nr:unnamed protein product [Nesidiocoris tenuis]